MKLYYLKPTDILDRIRVKDIAIAVLWRDAYTEAEKGVLVKFCAQNEDLYHKSYRYGELSTYELHELCPTIKDCLMLNLPQWTLRVLDNGYNLIISTSLVGIFDYMWQDRKFDLAEMLNVLHEIAMRSDVRHLLEEALAKSVERFVEAHDKMYATALEEIRNGRKWSHWIWYIFPQMRSLGHSPNAQFYGIESIIEARAFLNHPLLGAHLREITEAMLAHKGKDAQAILGPIDSMKLRSSMTLFDILCPNNIFAEVLNVFYDGNRCKHTLRKFSNEDKNTPTKD